jgi:hypothetical protein
MRSFPGLQLDLFPTFDSNSMSGVKFYKVMLREAEKYSEAEMPE